MDIGQMRVVRAGIKLLVYTIFLGILMLWIMYPTNTWSQQWSVAISSATDSTYFGTQGRSILVWVSPILLIAILGCLYLHLGNKLIDNSIERKGKLYGSGWAIWRRPVVVRGPPLGIVSGTELAFVLMFVTLVVWTIGAFVYKGFSQSQQATTHHHHHHQQHDVAAAAEEQEYWETKLERVSLYLGLVGNMCLAFLFFPVARGSSVLPMLGLTSEASIKYHIWIGHITMIIFTAHGFGYIFYWALTDQISQMTEWAKTSASNVAGEVSLMAGLMLWATTFPRIRRKMFELFFYTHYMYIAFIFFFILHIGMSHTFMMLPGFYLFMVDRYLRFLQSRSSIRLLSARVLLHSETVELNFSKAPGWDYNPMSTLFLNIPLISKLQWHPFTITSGSRLEPERLSVLVKSDQGMSWTMKLYQMLSSPSTVLDHLNVSIEGPYGPTAPTFLRHDMVVMVSGGSGIAPFISIIRELIFLSGTSDHQHMNLPQLLLICAFKKSTELAMLDLILPLAAGTTPSSSLSNLQLQIQAYVTREEEPQTPNYYSKPISTVWFMPQERDVMFSPILGPNSWLWLGAIISSSFVAFLILIGIITRYYIYPIDRNMNLYSKSARSVLNVLVLCVCIAATATGVVMWNKRKYAAAAAKQVQNIEGMSPSGSPDQSRFAADDIELESHPHDQEYSLVGATQVYYKKRPDLMRIMLELKGTSSNTSVGAMVCGPKKMRQEVAKICSSGLLNTHIHYESINFSW